MRICPLLLVAVVVRLAGAQVSDTSRHSSLATVSGVVRDSIARAPLADAIVQLIAADNPSSSPRTAISDSLGRFAIDNVPRGHYLLGFIHPLLDSLGVEATPRKLFIDGDRNVRADLGVPSLARLNVAICGSRAQLDSAALIIGVVRDALSGAPVAAVTVSAEWLELSFKSQGLVTNIDRRVATTAENGWFALCNVPIAGTVALLASRGADSTDRIELQIPPERFLHREIYIGPAQTSVAEGAANPRDMRASPSRGVHSGSGRLVGTVVAVAGGGPLAGAQVSIADGPGTRTNELGEWTILNAPLGTRMLEVLAVGYYPERHQVDVVTDAKPVRIAMSTLKAVLDTIRITARRLSGAPDGGGFQRRRRMGIGRFMTPEDVARFRAIVTSDLFRRMPGIQLEKGHISMRGAFEPWCSPAIFIDGHYLRNVTAEDIDDWVYPHEIAGVEIYSESTAPPQFQVGLSGCGSIVIWTK